MAQEKQRLTEQEKKNNHIASEQKRRLAIREGFDRLADIVPGLEGQGRSESIVLKKCQSPPPVPSHLEGRENADGWSAPRLLAVDHMREVLQERQVLIERIQALGGEIPPELR